jgi:hypothetical protein
MANGNRNRKGNRRSQSGGSKYHQMLQGVLGILAGVSVPATANPAKRKATVRLAVANALGQMGVEDVQMDLPDQYDETIRLTLRLLGNDPNEVRQIMSESLDPEVVADVQGATVETVKENRAQARSARKQFGFFSKEARAARQDLRSDRRTTRRERRRQAGGISPETVGAAMKIGAAMI